MKFLPCVVLPIVPALAAAAAEMAPGGDALRFINNKTGTHPFTVTETGKRPNIFLLSLDMVSPDHHHRSRPLRQAMQLPTIDSLLDHGVRFDNAFAIAPLCAPARAGLMTGRYTYITANGELAHDGHETTLRPTDVIFPEYLRAIGYLTKHCGKGHLGTQKFMDAFGENDNAWDRWAPPVFDDENYLAYLRRLGVKQQRFKRQITGLAPDRKTPGFTPCGGWIEQQDGQPFPVEAQYTYYLVERALEKVDAALADGGGTKPIYLQLDIFDPHNPFSIPAGFEEREKALRAAFSKLPASYEACLARGWSPDPAMPRIYGFYQKNWGMYTRELITDYRVANALQMEVIDRALARFVAGLKERRLYDEAVVIFTADHGEMNGRHGLCDKGVYLFPDTVRVPLAIKMPASSGFRPHVIAAPVSHLDLAATLMELTGIRPLARLDGRSLLPYFDGTGTPVDQPLFFECGQHRTVNAACGIQHWDGMGGHYLFGYNLGSSIDELYDLTSTDALNLAAKPEFATVRLDMIRRLGNFLQGQPRYKGYWASFQIDYYRELPSRESDRAQFRPLPH